MKISFYLAVFLISSQQLIEWGGFIIIAVFLFAETGLLLGLVVPGGETLLFTSGLLVSTDTLQTPLLVLLPSLIIIGIFGDISGYYIGKKFGKILYDKKDTWYFKKKYLHMTEDYYKKNKKSAILIGKFLPIIRPFNPVICGTTGMSFHVFILLSITATSLYVSAFILTGYFLGEQFPFIQNYLGWIIPISIVIALIPVVIQIKKKKRK